MNRHTLERIFSQSLVSAALNQSYDFAQETSIKAIYLKASTNITETITITLISPNGSNYDIILDTKTLNAEQNYVFHPLWDLNIIKGASIKIQCTNANITGTIYGTLHAEGGN